MMDTKEIVNCGESPTMRSLVEALVHAHDNGGAVLSNPESADHQHAWSDLHDLLRSARAALAATEEDAVIAWNRRTPAGRSEMLRKIEGVLNIPSAGHASAGELADTILDALGFTGVSDA